MKKLLLLLMFVTPIVFAQQQEIQIFELSRQLKCAKTEDLMNFITQNFGETMAWVGKDENNSSFLAIFSNKDTGTWSLIQYDSKIGCYLGSGTQGTPV
jgi:hypothetical protein